MYKKIVLLVALCFLFVVSCSSPNNPNSSNQGNNEDGGSTVPPPITTPTEEELIAKYGIDLGLPNEEISKKIKDNLKSYFDEMGSYRLIFTGTSKESYPNDTSLSFLTAKYASEINANNIVMDFSNVIFRNESIVAGMFSPGTTDTYEEIILKLVFEEGITTIWNSSFPAAERLKELVLPNTVTSIEDMALMNIGLTELIIPTSVTSIGTYAFASSINLTTITIPASVTSVGSGAFSACPNLTTVIYYGTSPSTIQNNDALSYCPMLTTLKVPNALDEKDPKWNTFLGGSFTTVTK